MFQIELISAISQIIHVLLLFFSFWQKMSLRQASVTTSPHVFVIATCIWSELIIYVLVSCNKQLYSTIQRPQHLPSLYEKRRCQSKRRSRMCKDKADVVLLTFNRIFAYYNLPRGKWSTLINILLRWRKCAGGWRH